VPRISGESRFVRRRGFTKFFDATEDANGIHAGDSCPAPVPGARRLWAFLACAAGKAGSGCAEAHLYKTKSLDCRTRSKRP
jgi:hypothetical protein